MQRPSLMPLSAEGESFAGFNYHLDGALVPALTIELNGNMSIYFEHYTMLWKSTGVAIGIKKLGGVFNRLFSGMPIFMTEATGSGSIAFSRDGAGQIFPVHLKRGQEIDVREHQFLAATHTVDYSFQRMQGIANILFGGSGFFIDKFVASSNDGIVWLHGYGNVFEITLAPGEQIDVEPSAWLYKDPSVRIDTNLTNLSTGLFAGSSFTLNRFTGPGKLCIQSMSLPPLAAEQSQTMTGTAQTVGMLGLAASAIKMFGKD